MSRTFKEAVYFFRHNLLKLIFYTLSVGLLVVILPPLVNSLFNGDISLMEGSENTIQPVTQIINLIIQPIYSGGLIILIYSLAREQAKTLSACLFAAITRWPNMFLANVVTSLMLIGGLMLFVIPGVWLFTRLFLVPFLVMLNNQSPFQAISNSFQYTKGYSFTILRDIVILLVVFILTVLVLNLLQILHPILLLLCLLLFQTMANVIYYRHYEILVTNKKIDMDDNGKLEIE